MEAFLIPVAALASFFFVDKYNKNKESLEVAQENFQDYPDVNYPETLPIVGSDVTEITSQLSVGNQYENTGAYTDKYFQPDPEGKQQSGGQQYRSLDGKQVGTHYFQHNNMVPFFGAKLRTLHTEADVNEGILDNYSGTGTQIINKKEVSPLFAPHESLQYAFGAPNQNDFFQSRVNPSKHMANVKPFGETKVGPGLGLGYTAEGSGGYNSGMGMREAWVDRSVDELRVKTNPKASGYGLYGHEGPAMAFVQERGEQGIQEKNRPDTTFATGPERYLNTTGVVKGNRQIPVPVIREVQRPDTSQSYAGVPKLAQQTGSNHYVDGEYHEPHSIELGQFPIQPAVAQGKYLATDGDYSYPSNRAYMNNRSLPSAQGDYFGAVHGFITEAIAPLLDVLRPSRKENAVGTLRPYQNAGSTVPLTYVYNPKDKLKTTLREATQNSLMHMQPDTNQRGGAYETTPHQPVENARYKTSDFYYPGVASAAEGSKQMRTYDAEYNQRNNNKKSSTNAGYTTGGNTDVFNADIQMRTKDIRDNQFKNRRDGAPVMPSQIPAVDFMGANSQQPLQLYPTVQMDRNNGEVLSQLQNNPFSLPLIRGL